MSAPSPGSPEAREQGCTCPSMDNHGGEGRPTTYGWMFTVVVGCPVHDTRAGAA